MKHKAIKKSLALLLAACMAMPSLSVFAEGEQTQVTVPAPYYEYTFDTGVEGVTVSNQGTKEGADATIDGNGEGLGVVEDAQRGSKVLNLPGGGLKKGCLALPENMFSEVTDEGFAFSFWINIDESSAHYNRIFSASSIELNSNNGDGGKWNAPEFTFVTGGTDTASGAYNTSIMMSDRKNQMKLMWEKELGDSKGQWQHVTISVDPDSYDVYLDGEKIPTTDKNKNQAKILESLFADNCAELKGYKHNAVGRSVYTTDNDLKAKIDEFRFYNVALTEEQAKAAYDSYAVNQEGLTALAAKIDEAKAYSISYYTRETYDALWEKITEAEEVYKNPVTDANVERMTTELGEAIEALEFYDGITADTTFSNEQLKNETKQAEELVKQDTLTDDSKKSLEEAIQKANAALDQGEEAGQEAVDEALKALREAVDAAAFNAALHFDAAEDTGELLHGSTGFLYGVSEVNVPSAELIQAIQPKILVQKAADGQQHPSGDGYRLTDYLEECGAQNIQIYLQDYYLQWPYEYNGIADYNEKVKKVVTKMVEGKSDEELEKLSFVLFNEPDGIWYKTNVDQLCEDWKTIYTTVKKINSNLKVAGPNYSVYNSGAYKKFFEYCQTNDCLPEYITWHDLQKGKLKSFKTECDEIRGYVDTYYKDSGIDPILFVNETANFEDVGTPGQLVNWLSIYEEEKVYASLPYWGLANSLNELAAEANQPNGAWWIYKWYAQMTGHTVKLSLENIKDPNSYGRLYGLTSVDDDNRTLYTLFGGQAGSQTICIDQIKNTETFKDADSAHVKIYRTKYTGHQGFAEDTPVVFEGDVKFTGKDLIYSVGNAELMDAYFAVVTPATGKDSSEYATGAWQKTYEAENATLSGGATAFTKTGGSDLARSNRAEVGGLNAKGDAVEFSVDVPRDGKYRLNIYYSSQAPQVDPLSLEYVDKDGQNRAIGALTTHTLSVDGKEMSEVTYDSTVKWGYYNYKTVYLDLTEGSHSIKLEHSGEDQNGKALNSMLCALLDKIDLVEVTDQSEKVVIEPEELSGAAKGFAFGQEGDDYTGAGYAEGSGDFTFYVCAPKDGYYTVSSKGSGSASLLKQAFVYAKDAKAESDVGTTWKDLLNVKVGDDNSGQIYLTAGMNKLKLKGDGLKLDQLVFTADDEATKKGTVVIEAEDCTLSGTDAKDDYNYLKGSTATPTVIENDYAQGKKAVEGFRGGQDNSLSFKVTVDKAGDYKLSMYYANNEPAPVMKKQNGENYVHPYNTDLVERYAQISVNGGDPQTVYFRNTLCWDTFKNVIMDVALKAGENTITITNDNSYKFSSVQDDFTPRFDRFEIASAVGGTSKPDTPSTEPGTTDKPSVSDKPGTTDNSNGADIQSTKDSGKTASKDSGKTTGNRAKTVKTGDKAQLLLYAVIMLAALGVICYMMIRNRKKGRKRRRR